MGLLLGLMLCLGCDLATRTLPAAEPVDVELVLAVDVSDSMDAEEFALQRAGYVEALRHPDFIDAVRAGLHGRIAVTYFEWAGAVREETRLPWRIIDGPETAHAFAAILERHRIATFRGTSISRALAYGAASFGGNGFDGHRKVIDVSGDGPNNAGTPVAAARDAAVAGGVVINGLPILIRPSPTVPALDRYYVECVTGGPGSFVLPVRHVSQFATAIRRKLILEVSGRSPPTRIVRTQAVEPIDCERGERDRRRLSDPYYPELDR